MPAAAADLAPPLLRRTRPVPPPPWPPPATPAVPAPRPVLARGAGRLSSSPRSSHRRLDLATAAPTTRFPRMTAHRRLDHAAAITVHFLFATVHHARSTTVDHVHAAPSLNHHSSPTEAQPAHSPLSSSVRSPPRLQDVKMVHLSWVSIGLHRRVRDGTESSLRETEETEDAQWAEVCAISWISGY
ncbi:hypothetical protein ABZP36_023125 [Zizania latifolia]